MIHLKQAETTDRDALIDLLWDNGMEHADPIEDYLLAVVGKEIVGCLRLEDHNDLVMIRPVVVSRDHRKRGVGRRLIQSLLSNDKPMAAVGRGEAVPFYTALGFSKAAWHMLPASQREECCACPDQHICRPQPMIRGCRLNTDDMSKETEK